jgi:hypothetical protein
MTGKAEPLARAFGRFAPIKQPSQHPMPAVPSARFIALGRALAAHNIQPKARRS